MSSISVTKPTEPTAVKPIWWLLAASVLMLVGYAGVFQRLVTIWWNKDDYGHGFAVPIVAAVYLWLRRDVIQASFNRSQPLPTLLIGIGFIVFAVVLRTAGILGRALPVEAFSIVPLAIGICCMLCGRDVILKILPACLFLVLMLPIPQQIAGPLRSNLQSVATSISVFSLQTMGVPAIARGNVIVLPDAEVGVAEACSGLRMIVSFTALVAAVTLFINRPLLERAVLLLAILPIAVIVNAWRVVVVSIATQYAPAWSETVHDWAGLLMMVLAAGLLWLLLKFMSVLFISDGQEDLSRPTASAMQ
jgi:exosortase